LKIAMLGASPGWHADQLLYALAARGHSAELLPITSLIARVGLTPTLTSEAADLDRFDVAMVRFVPRGSLEQIIFRMDALHLLARRGVWVFNSATAIERTVDKLYTSGLLAQAGLPTPRTIACEDSGDALKAFAALGGDVIAKPLFGAMGNGLVRIDNRDVAYRVFKALELERAVFYLQETIRHNGADIRAFVLGGQVVAAMERRSNNWRTNVARGGQAHPVQLTARQAELCVQAAAVVEADYAGVDLLPAADGTLYLLEVNSIPGWKGLQSTTPINIAGEIVAYLETELLNRAAGTKNSTSAAPLDA
jgi:RimK family alpha-L-glutamate ligase